MSKIWYLRLKIVRIILQPLSFENEQKDRAIHIVIIMQYMNCLQVKKVSSFFEIFKNDI